MYFKGMEQKTKVIRREDYKCGELVTDEKETDFTGIKKERKRNNDKLIAKQNVSSL